MSTLSDLVYAQGRSSEADVEWLHRLAGDGQLLADLAFADIVIWVPDRGRLVRRRRAHPPERCRDAVLSRHRRRSRAAAVAHAGARGVPERRASSTRPHRTGSRRPPRACAPCRSSDPAADEPALTIGVLTRHTNLGETRTPSRQQITFNDCADDLFGMIASGDFPDLSAPTAPRRGAPRASDGLIRLDVDGITTFASPNALSAFNRMGFDDELEGESLDRGDDPHPARASGSSTSRCRSS